jgi:hypothetical protein
VIDPIPEVGKEPATWEFGLQEHFARRAGRHLDVRVVDPEGKAHSWATRKLPPPGKGTYAIRQPTHTRDYALNFSGNLPKGFGEGKVDLLRSEPIEVTEANDQHIRFNLYSGRIPEQFMLKNVGGETGKRWLLRNITPARDIKRWQKLVTTEREQMGNIPLADIRPDDPNQIWLPKIDGASVKIVLDAGKPPRVFSYREAKNETGFIEHTHKLPGYWKDKTPDYLDGTVLRGEIYAVDKKGKVIPAAQIGGLLNASVWNSRKAQEERGLQLKVRTFNMERFQGKDVRDRPYPARLEALDFIGEVMPSIQTIHPAYTQKEKRKMVATIVAGKNPLTREGIIIRDAVSGKALKAKQIDPFDVYVREVVPGSKPGEMGALRYSLTPKGKIVGKVGTGFTQSQRRAIMRHPDQYIGRAAKVMAQQQFSSGALRAPVFTGEWHLDKGKQPGMED